MVDQQVKERTAKLEEEMNKLKKDLEEAQKTQAAAAPKTPAPKKTFGISRPSTAMNNGPTSTPKRTPQPPMSARGVAKKEVSSTPSKDLSKSTMGGSSGLKRPTTAATSSRLGLPKNSVA